MKKVKEILKINNATVLVCDLFDDSEITSRIKTNLGVFYSPEFEVEAVKFCFDKPKTRHIILKKHDIGNITDFKFIWFS